MILYVKGNLFHTPSQVLVNTVNTVGVMGKGIALEFKHLFPDMYRQYRNLCEQGKFKIGTLWLYKSPNKWVLNFPTKQHWRTPSKMAYIEAGLRKFVSVYSTLGIHSIAFPALGCGNGQLDFASEVQPLMEQYLKPLPIEVFIYPERDSDFVEHLNPKLMAQWLRSEPTNLPFSEVWEDLERLLTHRDEFKTIAKKSPFKVNISSGELRALKIIASGQTYTIHYETLLAFWQQLRTHGFSMRHIAPNINRQISYLIPVFSELDYVTPVHIADDYQNLQSYAITGLQVLPSAFSQVSANQPAQLSLFSVQ